MLDKNPKIVSKDSRKEKKVKRVERRFRKDSERSSGEFNVQYSISVKNMQRLLSPCLRKIENLVRSTLKFEKIQSKIPVEVNVVLVSDSKIRALNKRFHDRDRATDVLAFPMDANLEIQGSKILGDVIVSVQRAKIQSKWYQTNFRKEVALYVIHGLLHLLGYRDDVLSSKLKMEARQDLILEKFYRGI